MGDDRNRDTKFEVVVLVGLINGVNNRGCTDFEGNNATVLYIISAN